MKPGLHFFLLSSGCVCRNHFFNICTLNASRASSCAGKVPEVRPKNDPKHWVPTSTFVGSFCSADTRKKGRTVAGARKAFRRSYNHLTAPVMWLWSAEDDCWRDTLTALVVVPSVPKKCDEFTYGCGWDNVSQLGAATAQLEGRNQWNRHAGVHGADIDPEKSYMSCNECVLRGYLARMLVRFRLFQ